MISIIFLMKRSQFANNMSPQQSWIKLYFDVFDVRRNIFSHCLFVTVGLISVVLWFIRCIMSSVIAS